jgi:hypothetical protein
MIFAEPVQLLDSLSTKYPDEPKFHIRCFAFTAKRLRSGGTAIAFGPLEPQGNRLDLPRSKQVPNGCFGRPGPTIPLAEKRSHQGRNPETVYNVYWGRMICNAVDERYPVSPEKEGSWSGWPPNIENDPARHPSTLPKNS